MPGITWFVIINALGLFEADAQSLPWPFFHWTSEAQAYPTFRPQQFTDTIPARPLEFGPNINENPTLQWPAVNPVFNPPFASRSESSALTTTPAVTAMLIERPSEQPTNWIQTHLPEPENSSFAQTIPTTPDLTEATVANDFNESRLITNTSSPPILEVPSTTSTTTTAPLELPTSTDNSKTMTPQASVQRLEELYIPNLIPPAESFGGLLPTLEPQAPAESSTNESEETIKPRQPDGLLPSHYFDQATTSSTSRPPRQSDLAFYRPYNYNLSDLLNQPPIEISPYVQKPEEINIYCYPFDESEILGKCKEGVVKMEATGLMIPLMNEIQTPKSDRFYDNLARLKKAKNVRGEPIKIYGVAYDKPAWTLIEQILVAHKHLFDGLVLEWVGVKACPWNISSPTREQVKNIAESAGLPIQYFARQQDCDPYLLSKSANGGSFFNPNDAVDTQDLTVTKGLWPRFLKYIFPCFQGEEGPCYHAIRNHPEKVCASDLQKFAYSPFEALGGLMMYLKNETCHGLGDHVLYSVV